MKNRSFALRVLLAASLGASLALPGCRKYDQDGSLLHLRTPEARLIGTWNSARVQQLGTDADTNITELLSGNNLRLVADFRRDGGVTISKLESDLVYEGSWEFNEDKTILHLDLMYDRTLGPFYRDASGEDYGNLVASTMADIGTSQEFFFETGSYTDVTSTVMGYLSVLTKTSVAFTYEGGSPFFGHAPGDDVTSYMAQFITDFINEGLLDSEENYDAIVALMWNEYGVELSYGTTPPLVTGASDPALPGILVDLYGIQVTYFQGSITAMVDVLAYIADNGGPDLQEVFEGDIRQIDVYWKVLELERDDLQLYQFREFTVDNVYDFSYLLRFEKED